MVGDILSYYICNDDGKYLDLYLNVVDKEEAYIWKSKVKANNVLARIPFTLSDYNFRVSQVNQLSESSISLSFDNFADTIEKFYVEFIDTDKLNELRDKVSEADLKIVDIHHYIEFNKLNVVEGYKCYKMLHDILVERRKAKDELQKSQIICAALNYNKAMDLAGRLKEVDSKTYTPRILPELFD